MKNILILSTLSFLGLSVSAAEITPIRTVVAGQVVHRTAEASKVVTVDFNDVLSADNLAGRKLNDTGEFHTEHAMRLPQCVEVTYGDTYFSFLVNPGDSVFVELDATLLNKDDYKGIRFSGDNAETNSRFVRLYDRISSYDTEKIDKNLAPAEYLTKIKEAVKKQQDSLSVYIRENNLPEGFEKWGAREILFKTASSNLIYDTPADRLVVFTDPFFDICNEANFQTNTFSFYLNLLTSAKLYSDDRYSECIKNKNYEKATLLGLEILSEFPASMAADYMKYSLIYGHEASSPNLRAKLPENLFKYPDFETKLEKNKSTRPSFPEAPICGISYIDRDSVVTALPEQDFFKHLTSKHKGKIIYIDVYARWCGPCIFQFQHAKKLHELYGEEVVFVNLCLSSDYEQWLRAIPELEIEGENYFFDSDATTIFKYTYGVNGYPTYLLIDKNGDIATMYAPRPSELTKVTKAIDALK